MKYSKKLARPIIVRRVVGDSMLPTLEHDQLVVASGLYRPYPGDLVVCRLHSGQQVIKRFSVPVDSDQMFALLSDNPVGSNYSSKSVDEVLGRVVWPKRK